MSILQRAIRALAKWFIRITNSDVATYVTLTEQSGRSNDDGPPSDWTSNNVCPGNRKKCRWSKNSGNTAKRTCDTCGAEDWLMGNPYPAINEPAYFWRRMHDPNEPEPKWMKEAD